MVRFKDENSFKRTWIKEQEKNYSHIFCIETEETIAGFPDVLAIDREGKAHFFEFKYVKGKAAKFQPTQPAFYKKHSDLDINIVVYLALKDKVVVFPSSLLLVGENPLLKENGAVDLKEVAE